MKSLRGLEGSLAGFVICLCIAGGLWLFRITRTQTPSNPPKIVSWLPIEPTYTLDVKTTEQGPYIFHYGRAMGKFTHKPYLAIETPVHTMTSPGSKLERIEALPNDQAITKVYGDHEGTAFVTQDASGLLSFYTKHIGGKVTFEWAQRLDAIAIAFGPYYETPGGRRPGYIYLARKINAYKENVVERRSTHLGEYDDHIETNGTITSFECKGDVITVSGLDEYGKPMYIRKDFSTKSGIICRASAR